MKFSKRISHQNFYIEKLNFVFILFVCDNFHCLIHHEKIFPFQIEMLSFSTDCMTDYMIIFLYCFMICITFLIATKLFFIK